MAHKMRYAREPGEAISSHMVASISVSLDQFAV